MKNLAYILILLPQLALAQISGVINTYVKVTAVDPICNKVTVSPDPGGFSVGDTVLLIQMQGASIVTTNNATFGDVSSLGSAGNYEFGKISAIQSNDIYLTHTILRTYDPSGMVQLISVPQFSDVSVTGTLTAQAWDGNTGGVLVLEASGVLTLDADIDVSGLGFRGGDRNTNGGTNCNNSPENYSYTYPATLGGQKGEGIAGRPDNIGSGKGKNLNGGGGGNSHNTGGAGGGNYGTGGRGGNKSSSCTFFFTNGFGIGGSSLSAYYTNRIFMGGGGGGGHQNNLLGAGPPALPGGTAGGPGGGIVIIKAASIAGNNHSIISKGTLNPINRAMGDGAGGGGAGGTILLDVPGYSGSVTVDVSGSKGDDIYDDSGANRSLGPGGGGGGGVLWVSEPIVNASITLVASGGVAGSMLNTGTGNYFAEAGTNGGSLTNLTLNRSTTLFNQTCIALPVQVINYFAKYNSSKVSLCWTSCNEKDNREFIIEKSKDLHNYELVAVIPSQGNSITNLNYTAWDYNPYQENSYYRLSQKDLDGNIKVLKVAYVSPQNSGQLIRKIYPQPFGSDLSIELNENAIQDKAIVSIFNTIGQEVFTIESNSSELHLPLAHLPKGIYFLTVESGEQKETVKVVKSE